MKHSAISCARPVFHHDFDHRLSMYALAASSAGVSMLALVPSAYSEVIYTKTDKTITSNQTIHLDLNHDGVVDINIEDTLSTSTAGGAFAHLNAGPAQKGNGVWGHTVPFNAYASALLAEIQVGPDGQFLPAKGLMAASSISGGIRNGPAGNFTCTGPWAKVSNRYLGLKFEIKGKTHFGWARLNVTCSNASVTATLTGYAYETIAYRPIRTGQEKGTDQGSPATSASAAGLGDLARPLKGAVSGK